MNHELWKVSGDSRLERALSAVMPFGAHRGRSLRLIMATDPLYFDRLRDKRVEIKSQGLREAVQLVLNAHDGLIKEKRNEAALLR